MCLLIISRQVVIVSDRIGAFLCENLFQEIKFEKSRVKLRRMNNAIRLSGFAYRFFEFRDRDREISKRTLCSRFSAYSENDHCDC